MGRSRPGQRRMTSRCGKRPFVGCCSTPSLLLWKYRDFSLEPLSRRKITRSSNSKPSFFHFRKVNAVVILV